jgi:ABC-2 type transport system ATP-binding protein
MRQLGKKQLTLHLQQPLSELPPALQRDDLQLRDDGYELVYSFDGQQEDTGIAELLQALAQHGIAFKDLQSSESSLEDIFVSLVKEQA